MIRGWTEQKMIVRKPSTGQELETLKSSVLGSVHSLFKGMRATSFHVVEERVLFSSVEWVLCIVYEKNFDEKTNSA